LLTAIQLEQLFTAAARYFPPRGQAPRPTTVLLTRSVEEDQRMGQELGFNILNPPFFDLRRNQVVCGSDLARRSREVARGKAQHAQLRADRRARREELIRVYGGLAHVPPEVLKPVDAAKAKIEALDRANSDVVDRCHVRLVQCLCHEAFHAYLHGSVFA